jgi:hypothetical protein
MRAPAAGYAVYNNLHRRCYSARLDRDVFDLIGAYQQTHGVSFNRALNEIARLAGKVIAEPAHEAEPA